MPAYISAVATSPFGTRCVEQRISVIVCGLSKVQVTDAPCWKPTYFEVSGDAGTTPSVRLAGLLLYPLLVKARPPDVVPTFPARMLFASGVQADAS